MDRRSFVSERAFSIRWSFNTEPTAPRLTLPPGSGPKSRAPALAISIFILIWLLIQAKKELFVYYSADDIMNMYWAWTEPIGKLIAANLAPFTAVSNRPLGAAVYRSSMAIFGLHPLPMRILVYLLLLFNAWIVYRLARQLTGSAEIGVLAALFMSFHKRLFELYNNNGAIYDVLCCTFYLLTLLYYIRVRERGRPGWRQMIVLYALFVAALNSKEMAATVPAILLVYEIIYRRPAKWEWGTLANWLFVDCAGIWMIGLVDLFSLKQKLTPAGRLEGNPAYALHLTASQFFETTRRLFDNLFYQPNDTFTQAGVMAVIAMLLVIAIIARQKHIWFLTAFILITPLPVNFIVPRSLFAIYVTMAGWSIYAAALLVGIRDWLYARIWKRAPLPPASWEPERVFLFLFVVLVLWNIQLHDPAIDWHPWRKNAVYQLKTNIQRLNPKFERGSQVLFLDDRFTADDWIPVLLIRMLYRDPDLQIDRAKWMDHRPSGAEFEKYAFVFDYDNDQLVQVKPAPR